MGQHDYGTEPDQGRSASWRQAWGRKPPARHRTVEGERSLGVATHKGRGVTGLDIKPGRARIKRGKK